MVQHDVRVRDVCRRSQQVAEQAAAPVGARQPPRYTSAFQSGAIVVRTYVAAAKAHPLALEHEHREQPVAVPKVAQRLSARLELPGPVAIERSAQILRE